MKIKVTVDMGAVFDVSIDTSEVKSYEELKEKAIASLSDEECVRIFRSALFDIDSATIPSDELRRLISA